MLTDLEYNQARVLRTVRISAARTSLMESRWSLAPGTFHSKWNAREMRPKKKSEKKTQHEIEKISINWLIVAGRINDIDNGSISVCASCFFFRDQSEAIISTRDFAIRTINLRHKVFGDFIFFDGEERLAKPCARSLPFLFIALRRLEEMNKENGASRHNKKTATQHLTHRKKN